MTGGLYTTSMTMRSPAAVSTRNDIDRLVSSPEKKQGALKFCSTAMKSGSASISLNAAAL